MTKELREESVAWAKRRLEAAKSTTEKHYARKELQKAVRALEAIKEHERQPAS